MDGTRFDRLTRQFATSRSRRSFLTGMLGGAAGAIAAGLRLDQASAARRGAGQICRKHGDCQSNLCGTADRTGRRRCACGEGQVGCDGACVDPETAFQTDNDNCGACGFQCPTLQACCDAVCLPVWAVCNGVCCSSTQACYEEQCCDLLDVQTVCAEACGEQSIGCGQTTDCGPCCGDAGSGCELDGDCCSGACVGNECLAAPGEVGATCDSADDCQSGVCCGGVCVAADAYDDDPNNCGACENVCPGSATECGTRTCVARTCGMDYVSQGTPTTGQTQGDCQLVVCDGQGGVTSVADDTDVASEASSACMQPICSGGVPGELPLDAGTPCNENGGSVCDGNGSCVGCVVAAECPGVDSECQTRTCNNGDCGFSYTPAGTPTSDQTPGDCQVNVCDGAGGVTTSADDDDLPAESSSACMQAICAGGAPSETPVDAGVTCDENGGSVCDGNGNCVECIDGTSCSSGACEAGVCCVADDISVTCAEECGEVANNCGVLVDCGACCPAGTRPSSIGDYCVPDQATCSAAMVTGANLSQADLRECDFSGLTVVGVNLSNANLTGATFAGSSLTGFNFSYAFLNGVSFSGTTLVSTQWAFAICPDGVEAGFNSAQIFSCCGNMNGNAPASCG